MAISIFVFLSQVMERIREYFTGGGAEEGRLSCCDAQAGLKLVILLTQPPECCQRGS